MLDKHIQLNTVNTIAVPYISTAVNSGWGDTKCSYRVTAEQRGKISRQKHRRYQPSSAWAVITRCRLCLNLEREGGIALEECPKGAFKKDI